MDEIFFGAEGAEGAEGGQIRLAKLMARRGLCSRRDAEVWIADPGRAYLPREGMQTLSTHAVPTSLELEDRAERLVTIARLLPC